MPKPGMYFLGDDGHYYIVLPTHPSTPEEPCIKYTDRDFEDTEVHYYLGDFWRIRQLLEPELKRLLQI